MNKINNTTIANARQRMFDLVNEMLMEGMPIAIIDIVIDLVSSQVKTTLQNHIEQEKIVMSNINHESQGQETFATSEDC